MHIDALHWAVETFRMMEPTMTVKDTLFHGDKVEMVLDRQWINK